MATRTPDRPSNYERLRDQVRDRKVRGNSSTGPNDKERADWAYGNTKMENEAVTREMAKRAVERRKHR
jgi:hypothetical protein